MLAFLVSVDIMLDPLVAFAQLTAISNSYRLLVGDFLGTSGVAGMVENLDTTHTGQVTASHWSPSHVYIALVQP